MSENIRVQCQPASEGWMCTVRVGIGQNASSHRVSVSRAELDRLMPLAREPDALVTASFEFLLAREPRESILSNFELSIIERYFPDYPMALTDFLR